MTTQSEALNALADRVEREEPSLRLDEEIALACGWETVLDAFRVPRWRMIGQSSWWAIEPSRYTTSLDAAVTLVPEGWDWLHSSFDVMTCVQKTDDDKAWPPRVHGTGRTLAAALTSAALRARAADMQARCAPHPSRTA